jgi:hypothetical protein
MKFTSLMLIFLSSAVATNHKKILIKDVDTLVLREGHMTTGRRSNPVPQLTCLGDCRGKPDAVVCKNIGSDGKDAVWKCTADIVDGDFLSSSMDVSCEGWDNPDDPYILAGSCGLTYRLKQKYAPRKIESNNDPGENALGSLLAVMLICGLLMSCAGPGNVTDSYSYSSRSYDSSPGFWTGAAAGYMAGSSRSPSYSSSSWGSNSSWGGGGSSWSSRSSGFSTTSRR